jgi:hypothetical protein
MSWDEFRTGNAESWSPDPVRSGATLLFIRRARCEIASLAFCSATFVELDGSRGFSSPKTVERLEWTRAGCVSATDPNSPSLFDAEVLRAGTPIV